MSTATCPQLVHRMWSLMSKLKKVQTPSAQEQAATSDPRALQGGGGITPQQAAAIKGSGGGTSGAIKDGAMMQQAHDEFMAIGGRPSGAAYEQYRNENPIQKYPSRFFFSIDPVSSLSIRRPWRSEVLACIVSRTIFSNVEALLSMAPVKG